MISSEEEANIRAWVSNISAEVMAHDKSKIIEETKVQDGSWLDLLDSLEMFAMFLYGAVRDELEAAEMPTEVEALHLVGNFNGLFLVLLPDRCIAMLIKNDSGYLTAICAVYPI